MNSWSVSVNEYDVVLFETVPFGRFALAAFKRVADRIQPNPQFVEQSRIHLRPHRGLRRPHTKTWPTPSTCDSFCDRIESAASYICGTVIVSEVSPSNRMGASAGFTLR